jgi:hypothetical protein
MRRLTALALVALLCVAIAACGGDDTASTKTDDTAKNDDTSTTDDTTTDDTKADTTAGDAQLAAKLLTLDDVGPGWEIDPSVDDSADDEDEDMPDCFKELDDNAELGSAAIGFQQGEQGFPSFEEDLDLYEAADIADELDHAVSALDDCGDFSFDSEGTRLTGSVHRVDDAPKFGDESATWQMQIGAEGTTIDFLLTYLRKGAVGASLVYSDFDDLDTATYQSLIEAAVAKL